MKTLFIVLVCAIAFFLVSLAIDFVLGDPVTSKEVARHAISGIIFAVIFVPIILRTRKKA